MAGEPKIALVGVTGGGNARWLLDFNGVDPTCTTRISSSQQACQSRLFEILKSNQTIPDCTGDSLIGGNTPPRRLMLHLQLVGGCMPQRR